MYVVAVNWTYSFYKSNTNTESRQVVLSNFLWTILYSFNFASLLTCLFYYFKMHFLNDHTTGIFQHQTIINFFMSTKNQHWCSITVNDQSIIFQIISVQFINILVMAYCLKYIIQILNAMNRCILCFMTYFDLTRNMLSPVLVFLLNCIQDYNSTMQICNICLFQTYADTIGISYIEVSAKCDTNVEVPFILAASNVIKHNTLNSTETFQRRPSVIITTVQPNRRIHSSYCCLIL